MADTQEQNLAAAGSLALTDLVRVVTTPGAVPASKNITLDNLQKSITNLPGITDIMVPSLQVRTVATFSVASNITPANVPGLSVNLLEGHNYRFTARLHCTGSNSYGVRAAMGGTVTAGTIIYDVITFADSAINKDRFTALGGSNGLTAAGTVPYMEVNGFIAVAVGGTLTVQFAQKASGVTPSVVQVGSSLFVEDVA